MFRPKNRSIWVRAEYGNFPPFNPAARFAPVARFGLANPNQTAEFIQQRAGSGNFSPSVRPAARFVPAAQFASTAPGRSHGLISSTARFGLTNPNQTAEFTYPLLGSDWQIRTKRPNLPSREQLFALSSTRGSVRSCRSIRFHRCSLPTSWFEFDPPDLPIKFSFVKFDF